MNELHCIPNQANIIRIKQNPNDHFNVAVIASYGGKYALSITRMSWEGLIPLSGQKYTKENNYRDLKGGPSIGGGGSGYVRGKEGFCSEDTAREEFLKILGNRWNFCGPTCLCAI